MPIEYTIHENGHYVYSKATGKLTPEEIIEHEHKLQLEPTLQNEYKELFDVRYITKSEVNIDSFQRIIKEVTLDNKRNIRNKLAIVASTAGSFDRAKYYEKSIPSEKQNVIVFNILETAKIWLNVDKPER